ncbi:RNA polymerase sigma factor [Acidobacteriia bacterium AH_259_A11_L15]|nr:RNA polymerase sigma factor [Acidobacteriia bacterium AH_259_A11_L15]
MLAFKRGEAPAFGELFARYKDAIYGYVRRRVNDPSRAEEITQDVFLALVQHRNGYEVEAKFRIYLYRIALNRIVSEHRKKKEEDPLPVNPAAGGGDAALVQQVREALGRLEAEQREIVLLREYQGLSYQEIAEVLQVPLGTVRSRLFRAKLALRDLLGGRPVRQAGRPVSAAGKSEGA